MDPDKLMDGISKELDSTFKAMKKAKTAEDKLIHSKIIKNLCESMGVFLELINAIVPYDEEDAPF